MLGMIFFSRFLTIDKQYIFAVELESHGIQLSADILASSLLSRHDESSSHVAVLVETFSVRKMKFM